jgi:anti-sigma factor RsiW
MEFKDEGTLFCDDVELMLQDYLDGYLLPSQREVLEAHVRRCDTCRALLSGLTRIDDRLESVGEVDVPEDLARSILSSLPPQAYAPTPLRRALAYGAVPAALVLAVVLAFLVKGRYVMQSVSGAREVEVVLSAPGAASVAVVGDFNGWNPQRNLMVRSNRQGEWRGRLRLPRGTYQYSFVIDGTSWVKDPQARTHLADGFGGVNSVMVVDG